MHDVLYRSFVYPAVAYAAVVPVIREISNQNHSFSHFKRAIPNVKYGHTCTHNVLLTIC